MDTNQVAIKKVLFVKNTANITDILNGEI